MCAQKKYFPPGAENRFSPIVHDGKSCRFFYIYGMKMQYMPYILFLAATLSAACRREAPAEASGAAGEAEAGIPAMVLSPAGSVDTWVWDTAGGEYRPGPELEFLPYPANFGYLPATARKGGPPPLEVLLIGQRIERRTAGILPIGLLRYVRPDGSKAALLVATPERESLRSIAPVTFREFLIEHDAVKRILETWFLHHQGYGALGLIAWEDEAAAQREIRARSLEN